MAGLVVVAATLAASALSHVQPGQQCSQPARRGRFGNMFDTDSVDVLGTCMVAEQAPPNR